MYLFPKCGWLCPFVIVAVVQAAVIEDDTYFYGQSPPVYPSPKTSGLGDWSEAFEKAVSFVSQMTLEEKANITVGFSDSSTGCTGRTGTVPRLDWPGICFSGNGNSVHATEFVNSWPSGIHVGASWNHNLSHERGSGMGGEFRKKGANVAGGPMVGPLGRVALGGRNWEGFSTDPYLSGQLAAQTVDGIQGAGVISCTKHFLGNEQETYRLTMSIAPEAESVSSNMDDRTMHETYLWPFADALHAGAGAIMCSYNRLNNSYACQNSKALNGLLKTELGFQGWVVSDWYAQHSGVASAHAGLDIEMPTGLHWGASGKNLIQAVRNGSLAESRVTDMATRILASWYQLGQDNPDSGYSVPGHGLPKNFNAPHQATLARDPASKDALLRSAQEGHVLVKNTKGALPLKKPKLLSIFGYDAHAPPVMNAGDLRWSMGLESFTAKWASKIYAGLGGVNYTIPQHAGQGTIIGGGGSGSTAPAYISSPFDAISERAYQDDTSLFWDFISNNPLVDVVTDACLVFINAWASEGFDRVGLHDDYSDALILNVAANCSNTIVVIHNAGIRLVDQWIDHPNITGLIFAHLPGQDSGRALVSLLYGDVSPSGKLPYTVARNESDYEALNPSLPKGKYELFPQSNFSEGLFTDYRHFDANDIEPRYEFGFGLSYTTFDYTGLSIEPVMPAAERTKFPPKRPMRQGGNPSLWDIVARVSVQVTNAGDVAGAEVAQLYVGVPYPDTPVRQLRGFDKKLLQPGETLKFEFELMRKDLSVWDVVAQDWAMVSGEYDVYVGRSSRDLPLKGKLEI